MSCSWSSQDGQTPKTLIHPHLAGHDFVHLSVSQQPTREGTSCVNQVDNRLFESEKTLEVVVSCANYIIRTNDGVDDAPITQYDSKVVPGFTFESYAHRLKTHFQCSDAAIILGMIYVTKVVDSMSISLTQRNVHRVYLVCLLIACKFIEDHFYTNTYYAKSGGVSLDEMNRLEVQTLKQLDWNFCVSRGCYFDFIRSVLGSCGNPRAVISQLPPRELYFPAILNLQRTHFKNILFSYIILSNYINRMK